MFEWDYFQAQITKYLMRWKFKHDTPEKRLEDLNKARHFLDKYIEMAEAYDKKKDADLAVTPPTEPKKYSDSDGSFKLEGPSMRGGWVYSCLQCGDTVVANTFSQAHEKHGSCPKAKGYVAQDR
jgi:hypothetical protein